MKDKKKVFASLFIAFIMVFSIFGFIMSYSLEEQAIEYKDYEFVQTPQGWLSVINKERFFFSFTPQEVEFLTTEDLKKLVKNRENLTLSYNPKDFYSSTTTELILKIHQDLPKIRNVNFNYGLTNNTGYDLPLVTCESASQENPVIIFEENEDESSVTIENNCVKLKYTTQLELLQQGEALFYVLAGII